MAVSVYFLLGLADWQHEGGTLVKGAVLATAVGAGLVSYVGIGLLLGVEQIRQGWTLLKKRKRGAA
jgi:hypothetical protein